MKLAAIFIAGFNFVTLLVTVGLQRFNLLPVRSSHLPKSTPLEQDELRVSPFPLETVWTFWASRAWSTQKLVRVVRVLREAARERSGGARSGAARLSAPT